MELHFQMLSKEVTPCPPYIPNERIPYDELRVWLEMHLRGHYADIKALWESIGFGEFTPGSVIFADTDGSLTEDNPNFFYDDTNNRLGIGTAAPATYLHVLGTTTQLRLGFDATKYTNFTVDTNHDLTVKPTSTGQIIFQPTTDSTDFFQVLDADGGTPIVNVDSTNERLGVGLNNPRDTIEVYKRIIFDPTLFNTLIGDSAGNDITTGTGNTVLGYQADYNITDLSGNVVIGYQANYTEVSEGAGGDVIIGYQAGYSLAVGSTPGENVIIGYQAAYTDREMDSVVIGFKAGYYMSSSGTYGGQYNVYIGRNAGYGLATGNSGYQNTGIGDQTMQSNSAGFSNTTVGCSALFYNEDGDNNVAIGYSALEGVSATDCNLCIAVGALSGRNSADVWGNVSIGYSSLLYNVSGQYNTIIGTYAARGVSSKSLDDSVVIGAYAGYSLDISINNTICGFYAGYSTTTGGNNSIYGWKAGYSLTTGASNIFIGYDAGYYQTTDSNIFLLDNQSRSVANHELYKSLFYGVMAAASGDQDLTINADVLVRNDATMGSESLSEGDFTTHADWDVTGDEPTARL